VVSKTYRPLRLVNASECPGKCPLGEVCGHLWKERGRCHGEPCGQRPAALLPVGERHLRHLVRKLLIHYMTERYHQGIGGRIIRPAVSPNNDNAPVGAIQRGDWERQLICPLGPDCSAAVAHVVQHVERNAQKLAKLFELVIRDPRHGHNSCAQGPSERDER
jgi:hypothetical protein